MLTYSIDKNGKVQDMKCTVCAKYEEQIKGMPNFSNVFTKGSKNYRKSVIEEHANKSGPYLQATSLHLKCKGVPLIGQVLRGGFVLPSERGCSTSVFESLW